MAEPEKNANDTPAIQDASGRDPVTGRFLPGVSGNPRGRPAGYDFRKIVRDRSEGTGLPVELAVWRIYQAMVREAVENGDTQAAKLILDRLCENDPTHLYVTHDGQVAAGPPVPATPDLAAQIEKLAQLGREFLTHGKPTDSSGT